MINKELSETHGLIPLWIDSRLLSLNRCLGFAMSQSLAIPVPCFAGALDGIGFDVRLSGGLSATGFCPCGLERRRFVCVGLPELASGPREDAVLGHVELFVRPMRGLTVEGLVVIAVRQDRRRRGYGRRIVDAVRSLSPGPLVVHGVTDQAIPFWQALGATIDRGAWRGGPRTAMLEPDCRVEPTSRARLW